MESRHSEKVIELKDDRSSAMDAILIASIVSMLVTSIVGVIISRLFKPGIYLIYAQTFASGAFIGIAILHFIPEAVDYLDFDYPYYSLIILIVFSIFSIGEFSAMRQPSSAADSPGSSMRELAMDYSVFLMHHFTTIPSFWLQLIIYLCFLAHSVVLGLAFAFQSAEHAAVTISLLLFLLIEKFLEAFTVTLMLGRIERRLFFWALIVLYSIVTPLTIIVTSLTKLKERSVTSGICLSISAGVFIFIGLVLWRKTFLTPFDWKRRELALVCVFYIAGVTIPAVTRVM
jgi:zinc transporter ZupT